MPRREHQRHAFLARLPQHVPIGELALARDFRRPLLSVRIQDRAEQHRHRFDRVRRVQRLDLLPVQIRKRRQEIEVPAQRRASYCRGVGRMWSRNGRSGVGDRPHGTAGCARKKGAARSAHQQEH